MTTRSRKTRGKERAQETSAPDLQIVTSEPDSDTPPATEADRLFDRLKAQYDTSHMPDTDEMTLTGGEKVRFRLLKTALDQTAIQGGMARLLRLCEDTERVKKPPNSCRTCR